MKYYNLARLYVMIIKSWEILFSPPISALEQPCPWPAQNGMHMLQPVTVIAAYSNCGWPHPQRCFKKKILQKLGDVWCKATMQHVQAQTPCLFRCLLYHISTWFAKRSGIDTKHHHLQQHHQCFGEGKAGTTPSKHRAFPWDWIDPKPVSGV